MKPARSVDVGPGELPGSAQRFSSAGLLLLLFSLFQILVFLFAVYSGAQRAPYADQLAYISTAYSLRDGALSLPAYLWLPHLGHHIVWVRVLTILDMIFFHGSLWLQILSALASMLGLAWLCSKATQQACDAPAKLFGAVAGAALILTSYNASDVSQTGNIVYAFAAFFTAAAIRLSLISSGRLLWAWRLAALCSAVLAAFGNAVALAAWPALLFCSVLNPLGWKKGLSWTFTILAVGTAFSLAYLLSGQAQALHDSSTVSEVSVAHRAFYFLTFLGAPISRISALAGCVAGLALVAAAALFAKKTDWNDLQPVERFAWSIMAFALITAFMAALGRADLGMDRAPQRYGILASLFQVGLLILTVRRVAKAGYRPPRWALVLFLCGLVAFQIAGAGDLKSAAKRSNSRVAAFRSGDRTATVVSFIYPDTAFAEALYARMDRDHLYTGDKPSQ